MHDSGSLSHENGAEATSPPRPILICEDVWKIFGAGAESAIAIKTSRLASERTAFEGLSAAVRNVSLKIFKGEIFVIMGLSGSGKSTLVRCMSRLIEPTVGRVIFDDTDLLQASERKMIEFRRHKMGMVFQHFALLPHLPAIENVAFPLEVQGIDRKTRLDRASKLLDLVGLDDKGDHYPHELSGGQQQRVGIARSLAVEPDIWFLDEPFSALDPLIRAEMQEEFLRLQRVLQKSIVFITHDFDEAIRVADRIAIMKSGEVVQIGTPEELVLEPATAYVAEFTKKVSRAKVLSIGSVMAPPIDGLTGRAVRSTDKVEHVAAQVLESNTPVPVKDGEGSTIGSIGSKTVSEVLLNRFVRQ